MRAKLIVAFVFLCAAASVAGAFFFSFRWEKLDEIAAEVSPVVFVAASVAVFLRPRIGYWLGLTAGLTALLYFVHVEIAFARLTSFNSWLFMNCEAGFSIEVSCTQAETGFRLLAFVFVSVSVACAVLQLLPTQLALRGSPLNHHLWPAFVVSVLGLVIWFVNSASPYRIPAFHDGVPAQLRILHVEKRGFRFHETSVFEFRDGKISVTGADRRWFQYRFGRASRGGAVSPTLYERARDFIVAAKDWKLHTPPPRALWAWNAEGWYVVTPDRRFSFTTTDGTQPPQEVTALFRELESPVPARGITSSVRDVCLGFCYDPPAALGLASLEARSWLRLAQ